MFNNKGQESIVFEVLIAVILMTFVFVIGGYAMNSLNQTKCSKEIDSTLSDLSLAIEKAGSISIGSHYYSFSESSCFKSTKTIYRLENHSGTLCSSYCPGTTNCYLLKYDNPDDPVSSVRYKCVNISRYVNFNTSFCQDISEYSMPGFEYLNKSSTSSGIVFSSGNYLFQARSLSQPTICIYLKNK